MTRCLGRGLADFSERHPLSLVAGERALERPNAGMHTNGSSVSLHCVFQLVARFNSQGLSNFLGNGRLSLTCHCRMYHRYVLTFQHVLTDILALTSSDWQGQTATRAFHPNPAEAKALSARGPISKVLWSPDSVAEPFPMLGINT